MRLLPALPRLEPATTLTEVISVGANENIHARLAGAPPLLLNERLKATEFPVIAEPEERLRTAV